MKIQSILFVDFNIVAIRTKLSTFCQLSFTKEYIMTIFYLVFKFAISKEALSLRKYMKQF
jgi:hypothetical protein